MTGEEITFVIGGLAIAYCSGWGMGTIFLTFKQFTDKIT
jgi:hypothetical protein